MLLSGYSACFCRIVLKYQRVNLRYFNLIKDFRKLFYRREVLFSCNILVIIVIILDYTNTRQCRLQSDWATDWTTEGSWFNFRQKLELIFSLRGPEWFWGKTHRATERKQKDLSPEVKRLGSKADKILLVRTEVNNGWSYNFTPPYAFKMCKQQIYLLQVSCLVSSIFLCLFYIHSV